MTIEEVKDLIHGEVYLFKYKDLKFKRFFESGCLMPDLTYYLIVKTVEQTPVQEKFYAELTEVIGIYNQNGHQTEPPRVS